MRAISETMDKVGEANRRVRKLILDDQRHTKLRRERKKDFNQILASLDVIDDTAEAIDAYGQMPNEVEIGLRYLLTYGILEALYLQQNAVEHLCEATGHHWRSASDHVLALIRDTRHQATGHPTKKDRPDPLNPTFHGIVRISMTKEGFEMHSWTADSVLTTRAADLVTMIQDQERRLARVLRRVSIHIESDATLQP